MVKLRKVLWLWFALFFSLLAWLGRDGTHLNEREEIRVYQQW
jgi:hypothetical protein